jgi:hypothetical protein
MTMTTATTDPHLEDWELVELLDGGADLRVEHRRRTHLAACGSCAARFATVEVQAGRLSGLIGSIELPDDFRFPVPPAAPMRHRFGAAARPARRATSTPPWLRAAAAMAALAVGLAVAGPLRAWVGGWFAADRPAPAAVVAPSSDTPAVPRQQTRDVGATVSFAPAGPELRVEFARPQRAGTVQLRRAAGAEVRVEVIGAPGGTTGPEMPLVTDNGVRVLNGAASTASYRVSVPRSVERVRLRIGDGASRVIPADAVNAGRTVGLGGD